MNAGFSGQKFHQCNINRKCPEKFRCRSISKVALYFSRTEEPWVERTILTLGETGATSDHGKRGTKANSIFCPDLSISFFVFTHKLKPCIHCSVFFGLLVLVWMIIGSFSKCHKTNSLRNMMSFRLHLKRSFC